MAEAHDARELVEAQAAERDAEFFPLNDLPNDVLVSVFAAVEDPTWVRHTFPLVCRAWNELYCSKDASPLHETLEIHFEKEVERAKKERRRGVARPLTGAAAQELAPRRPVVHASRVIAWAERRAGDVRKLHLERAFPGALEDFTAEDFSALLAAVGPSLTEFSIGSYSYRKFKTPLWETLRTSVVPAGRLRSFAIRGIESDSVGSDLEPLGQLSGSLEELVLWNEQSASPLSRIPESFFALKELRRLILAGHEQIRAIPAGISSLKKLELLDLRFCGLSSLPRELGDLSGLTGLGLAGNSLGDLPEGEAFPPELKEMKSLRGLDLTSCGLRTVPAFVYGLKSLDILFLSGCKLSSLPKKLGELKSLDILFLNGCDLSSLPKELGELSGLTYLDVSDNKKLGTTPEDEAFPAELGEMKSLEGLKLFRCGLRTVPAFVGRLESLETLCLHGNDDLQFSAPLDFLIEGCPRLREVMLTKGRWTPRSLAHLGDFEAKLLARNPKAEVFSDFSESENSVW